MELSPFDYTGPLPPRLVRGRTELLEDLTRRVTRRTPTALLGPRRFGKTSVLGRLASDLTELAVISVDLMPVQSARDAALALLHALTDAGADVRQEATSVSASLGFDLLALRGELRTTRASTRSHPGTALHNLVDTLTRTALARPTLIVFDEFQQLGTVDNGTALLRAALQHHYKDIGLLFAGSAPSAMRSVFANHDQPFLQQVDLIEIGPLTVGAVTEIVHAGFEATGRQPGTLAALLHRFTGGHPLRTMQAADRAWQHAEDRPGDEAWGEALGQLRRRFRTELEATYGQLYDNDQRALRLLAHGESLYGPAAATIDLGKSAGQQALARLRDDGHVATDPDKPVVTDPFLADWLRQHRPL